MLQTHLHSQSVCAAPLYPLSMQGLIINLLAQVEARGFVPNGLRSYYCNRSQPPLLSQVAPRVVAAGRHSRGGRDALPLFRSASSTAALKFCLAWRALPSPSASLPAPHAPQMVAAVHAAAPDRELLQRSLRALLREHAYWTAPPKQVGEQASHLELPDGAGETVCSYSLAGYSHTLLLLWSCR